MVTLKDVLFVLEQDSLIDIRVRMAKVLLQEMIKQQGESSEVTNKNESRQEVVQRGGGGGHASPQGNGAHVLP